MRFNSVRNTHLLRQEQALLSFALWLYVFSLAPQIALAQPGDFFDDAWSTKSSSPTTPPTDRIPSRQEPAQAPAQPPEAPSLQTSSAQSSAAAQVAPSEPEEASSEVEEAVEAAAEPGPIEVFKGILPKDKRYWDFVEWYKNHAVVSLIVSGENSDQLAEALEDIRVLKDRGVAIGEIIIVGGDRNGEIEAGGQPAGLSSTNSSGSTDPSQTVLRPTRVGAAGKALQLEIGAIVDAQTLLNHFDARYSPFWIIRYHGTDYTYEGSIDPKRLFSASGQYTDGER